MEIDFTPLQKRAIAIVLLAIPVIAVLAVIVQAIVDWSDHHARMAVLDRERATYERLMADLPQRTKAITDIKASGADEAAYKFAMVSVTSDKIERAVAEAIKTAGGTVGQASMASQSPAYGGFVRIYDQVTFSCDVATLTRVLHEIAQAKPSLFVEHLEIDDPGDKDPGPHRLNIDLVVAGYMRTS